MPGKKDSLTKEIEQGILDRLDDIKSSSGALPSEPEIARMFNVSRVTVRQALTALENQGLVSRKHGSGTFVNPNILSIQSRLDMSIEFNELIRQAGYDPGIKLVSSNIGTTSPEIAETLGIPPQGETLTLIKVFYANQSPIIYCLDIVPIFPHIINIKYLDLTKIDLAAPIYNILSLMYNITCTYMIADIEACATPPEIASELDYSEGAPILQLTQTTFTEDDVPAYHAIEYFRPGFLHFRLPRKIKTKI